jgi:radical SAM protein with 4Fe4S-binding SPASM domain
MTLELKAPIDVQIELTQECNQLCQHCYNFWREATHNERERLSLEEIGKIVSILEANQVPSITITGGEPFLRRRELFALLEAVQRCGIRASINSNFSTARSEDIIQIARDYPYVSILVSVLSSDPDVHEALTNTPKGTHARALRNIKIATDHGLRVSMNMVLLPQNVDSMKSLAKIAKGLGIKTFCATKVLPPGSSKANVPLLSSDQVLRSLNELIEIEKEFQINVDTLECYPKCLLLGTEAFRRFSHRICVAGKTTATIGSDGEVRPCSHVTVSYGNIFREPFGDIWRRMADWRNGVFLPEKCTKCPILAFCTGGCRVNSFSGDFDEMDFYADPDRIPSVPKERILPIAETPENLDFFDKVIISPTVGMRAESFGAVIFQPEPWGIILINKSAMNFLKSKTGIIFTFSDFLESSGAMTETDKRRVKHLYRKLIHKKMLIPPI